MRDRTAERAHITSSSRRRSKRRICSGVSVKKVEEMRREQGSRGERKKRRGRELCVLRSAHAFRDPGLNLSTFFSTYSHPQECLVAGCCPDSIRASIQCAYYREKFSMLAGSPKEDECAISKTRNFERGHLIQALVGFVIDDVRDCTLHRRNTRTLEMWLSLLIAFRKQSGKIVKIEHVILWSSLMRVQTRLRRGRLSASTCVLTCE